ncbi:mucin 17-like protein [Vibrio fortis]|uniref:Mucin 17-like protein n=2 Tax=Vibrio fortis TaxID=212667 RepID=A0A066UJI0_9VIBR|nr:mucin 17-like protein [Vibrio fortis]
MEGERLGFMIFPIGTAKVSAVCQNSCRAELSSTAAWVQNGTDNDPRPFGLYNYTGKSCTGSEGSGGSTGSGGDGSGSGGDGSGSGGDGSGSGGDGSGSGGDGSGSGGDGSGSGGDGSGSGGDGSGSGGDGSGSGGGGSGSDGSGSGSDGSGSGSDGSGSGSDGSGSGSDGSGSGSGGGGSGSGGSGSGSGGSGSGSGGSGLGSGGSGSGSGGGDSDGDGLTKGDIKDAIEEALGKSGTFTSPANGEGYGSGTALTGSVAALQTEVEELEDELKRKLKKSPLKLGQMSFSNGSYDGTSFNLSRWDVDVGFNLFSSLGVNNTDMIRTVILFIATLFAGFILLSSGRSKV